ncbi:MAG: hypothetical protein AB7O98_07070 [Hyphomonadaceae bacterium]
MTPERVLARLAAANAHLAPLATGGYGVFTHTDRRRRPLMRVDERTVRALASDGALVREGEHYVLARAGRARVTRGEAAEGEAFVHQHAADRRALGHAGRCANQRARHCAKPGVAASGGAEGRTRGQLAERR